MNLELSPGVYIVAVSGGVDSLALLHMLAERYGSQKALGVRLVVAHFEHGVREDSDLDRQLVEARARQYGLPFVFSRGYLGQNTSEDRARRARYDFLRQAQQAAGAKAIITAHHQDDLLETAILNLFRGTGWRGLVSLRSRDDIIRPLLIVSKNNLLNYASDQGIVWREDTTNQNLKYIRNYIRHQIISKFSENQRRVLLTSVNNIGRIQTELEGEIDKYLSAQPSTWELDRHQFIMLPHKVAREIMSAWLRRHGIQDVSRKKLERLVMAAKTYKSGRKTDVDKYYILKVNKKTLALQRSER